MHAGLHGPYGSGQTDEAGGIQHTRGLHPASFADQERTACQVLFSLRFYRMGSFVMPS